MRLSDRFWKFMIRPVFGPLTPGGIGGTVIFLGLGVLYIVYGGAQRWIVAVTYLILAAYPLACDFRVASSYELGRIRGRLSLIDEIEAQMRPEDDGIRQV